MTLNVHQAAPEKYPVAACYFVAYDANRNCTRLFRHAQKFLVFFRLVLAYQPQILSPVVDAMGLKHFLETILAALIRNVKGLISLKFQNKTRFYIAFCVLLAALYTLEF